MLKLQADYVAIRKVEKVSRTQAPVTDGPFKFEPPVILDQLGEVMYVGPFASPIKVGDLVYYGPQTENLRAEGMDLVIMHAPNVYGVLQNESQKEEAQV